MAKTTKCCYMSYKKKPIEKFEPKELAKLL